MSQFTYAQRLRYWFDNLMARGSGALIAWLFILSLILIFGVAGLVALTGTAPQDGPFTTYPGLLWAAMLRTLDAGTMASDDGHWFFKLAMLTITMGGIFLVSSLIGVISNGIESKIEDLRKGRSLVIEEGHTVILGWSPEIFGIISELVVANASMPRSCIAVLADREKTEMEDEIMEKVPALGNTRVVCRSGSPVETDDLAIVNLDTSRSILVLGDGGNRQKADIQVIKTLLAILNNPSRRERPYQIVAEIFEPQYYEVAKLVGREEAQLILVDDWIARIMVQTSLQPSLSVIYTELLDFDGDEIYFREELSLAGKTFRQALHAYPKCTVLGLRHPDGTVRLRPPMDTVLAREDKLILIAEDDSEIELTDGELEEVKFPETLFRDVVTPPRPPEQTIILGWNRRGYRIVEQLANYQAPGSTVTVVAALDAADAAELRAWPVPKGLSLQYVPGRLGNRAFLESLGLETYERVLLLSPFDRVDAQDADSLVLLVLLLLRSMSEKSGHKFPIVSEMLDLRNRQLAEAAKADDFIVSDQLTSLLMAQISENPELAHVFADLLNAEGSEFYLRPMEDYVDVSGPLDFHALTAAAARRGEIAVGYRIVAHAENAEETYGVRLNPPKAEAVQFCSQDRLIVLAEG